MKSLYDILGVSRVFTSGYRPQCNGVTERANGTLIHSLSKLAHNRPKVWPDLIDVVAFAYNVTPHSLTGYSPFYLVYGRDARLPLDLLAGAPLTNTTIEQRRLALAHALKRVNDINKQRMRLPKTPMYTVGDLVLYRDPALATTKLEPKWTGPYVVTEIITNVTFKVKPLTGNVRHREIIHASYLKPFYADNPKSKPP